MYQGKRKSKSIAGQPPDNPANNSKPINIPDFVLKREIKTLSSHARRPFQRNPQLQHEPHQRQNTKPEMLVTKAIHSNKR